MRRPISPFQTGLDVFSRRLRNVKWTVLGLAVFATLTIDAQIPRQMQLGEIVKREQARIAAVKANTVTQPQPGQTAKPDVKTEPVAAVVIPAQFLRPPPQPPIPKPDVKTESAGKVIVLAPPPRQVEQAKPQRTPGFLAYDQTDNSFQAAPDLPVDLRRVAMLPLAWEGSQTDLSQGSETLGPILLGELVRTKKFEVITVNPESLRSLTGRSGWTGLEVLPANFFDSLQRVYGCDAVLFCQLTTFHAYAPLAVGWRMKLVDARTGQILWAVDKIFDADQRTVLNRARRFHLAGQWVFHDPSNDWQVENSPRKFGQYTIAQALLTLPNRKEMTKVSLQATDVPSRRQNNKNLPVLKKDYGN